MEKYEDRIMKLTREECALVMENCFSNLFVTDGEGRIIYANHFSEEILGLPAEKLVEMTIYDLRREGYISHSLTSDVLHTGKQVTGSYYNKDGVEVACVCTPVKNPDGSIRMVVTFSRDLGNLGAFMEEIRNQQEIIRDFQGKIEYLDESREQGFEMVAVDPAMQHVTSLLRKIAPTDATIMLFGESGCGKEVMAKYIRQYSTRDREIFFPVNCAAIPAELIESELFGYERGAFTGASREGKKGLFELADKGTIFMDEIGELSLSAQSKLLRVLESGEYQRVGGTRKLKTDVRVIGATNRDLRKMVEEKTFREDLFYRLNVFPVQIPPLRERPGDLESLARMFLARYNRKIGRQRELTPEMLNEMKAYSWPGNIRELRNFMERYVITGLDSMLLSSLRGTNPQSAEALTTDPVPAVPQGGDADPAGRKAAMAEAKEVFITDGTGPSLKEFAALQELRYIRAVTEACGGNMTEAARRLGVHRSVLYRKLSEKISEPAQAAVREE